jgi:hypothetical protein
MLICLSSTAPQRARDSLREPICKVAQCHLRSIFRGKPRQAVRAATRTDAAGDTDHNEGIEGEAVAIVHGPDVRFLFLVRQTPPSLVFPPPSQWICPVCAHIPVIRGGLAEPVKSTLCCPSTTVLCTEAMRQTAVLLFERHGNHSFNLVRHRSSHLGRLGLAFVLVCQQPERRNERDPKARAILVADIVGYGRLATAGLEGD